jgi:hypothetical protein
LDSRRSGISKKNTQIFWRSKSRPRPTRPSGLASSADANFGGARRQVEPLHKANPEKKSLATSANISTDAITADRRSALPCAKKSQYQRCDIAAETGLELRAVADGQRVAGICRRSVMLASGRYAVLDDGVGFSLVPWKPVIEQRLGQQIAATVRGAGATWEIGRVRGPAVG